MTKKKLNETELCVDCKVNCFETNEYYMVTDACWKRAGMTQNGGMLCIGCLEGRLGKRLQPRDFSECVLNWRNVFAPDTVSQRLLSRYLGSNPFTSKWSSGVFEQRKLTLKNGRRKLVEDRLRLPVGKMTVVYDLAKLTITDIVIL